MKGCDVMITLAIILGAILLIAFIAIPMILIGGATVVFAFGDVILAILILILIVRAIVKHNKNKPKE